MRYYTGYIRKVVRQSQGEELGSFTMGSASAQFLSKMDGNQKDVQNSLLDLIQVTDRENNIQKIHI